VKLRVVWVGKTKDANITRLLADYAARIGRFLHLDIVELKDPKHHAQEEQKILSALDASDRIVVLDPAGNGWTSDEFAQFVGKHMRQDPRHLTFVIGGFAGLSETVKKKAAVTWSLSPLTFTHDLSRLLLLEQIYRALTIIHKHPYAK